MTEDPVDNAFVHLVASFLNSCENKDNLLENKSSR